RQACRRRKGPRRPPRPFPWQQRLRTRSTEHVERGTASPVRLQVLRTKRERQPQPYFEHGLHFEPSYEHAGLQLVDVLAYVTRRAILEPDNDVIHRAYVHLRDNLRTERDG